MTQIHQNGPLPGTLFANGAPPQDSDSLRAGDTLVYNGSSFLVIASGRLALAQGPVEVAQVEERASSLDCGLAVDMTPALASKVADYLGIEAGTRVSLQKEQVEWINQTIADYGNLMAGVKFADSLTSSGALATSTLDGSDTV